MRELELFSTKHLLAGKCKSKQYSDVAEGVGFEPTKLSLAGFQDRYLQPLGHPSKITDESIPVNTLNNQMLASWSY